MSVAEGLQITIPNTFKEYEAAISKNELVRNAMILYPLITKDVISHGKAAEMLGIDKMSLIQLYGEHNIPYFNQDISEIEKEEAVYYDKFRR